MNIRLHALATYASGLAAALLVASIGCEQGGEGDRCNPDLAAGENECGGGMRCTQPGLCPENYCCPVAPDGGPGASSNANCQTGCNGGAASICNSGQDDAGACAFACKSDPGDLTSTAICAAPSGADGGPNPQSDAGGADGGRGDGRAD